VRKELRDLRIKEFKNLGIGGLRKMKNSYELRINQTNQINSQLVTHHSALITTHHSALTTQHSLLTTF